MLTKEQWLSRHEAGNLRYESFGLDEVGVRLYETRTAATTSTSNSARRSSS
jgi:hypothetical protein